MMHPDFRARLDAAVARKNAERGRPLTAREKLENLAAWLAEDASVDTHAERGDAKQAPSARMGSAVAATGGETPNPVGGEQS
jgi:hypothetical protein